MCVYLTDTQECQRSAQLPRGTSDILLTENREYANLQQCSEAKVDIQNVF